MILYLLRHGIAINRDEPGCPPEADRFLTPKGIAKTKAAVRGLRALGAKPGLILTSPLLRAVQTAEIACEILGCPVKNVRRTEALKPDGKPAELFEMLARVRTAEVLCVGHAPNLDEVIAHAVASSVVFTSLKKAGLAMIEVKGLSPPHALLAAIYEPKVLRSLGE